MKNGIKTLIAGLAMILAASLSFGQDGKLLQTELVKWSTGSNIKTRLLLLANNVHLDTSSTGQAGQWKRIDNTADSCSRAVRLGPDSNGIIRPINVFLLWETVRAVDGDSSTHAFRVQTRDKTYDSAYSGYIPRYTPWTTKGANTGYTGLQIQDSILVPNARGTAKTSQYGAFRVAGAQARLCPDDVAATADAAGDSLFLDSIRIITQ